MPKRKAPQIVEESDGSQSEYEESSSEEEELVEEEEEEQEQHEEEEDVATPAPGSSTKLKISKISLVSKDVCKVCGKSGHSAGFVGSVYMDCINKPCYLCKQVGHTTATCPFRLQPGHGAKPAVGRAQDSSIVHELQMRQMYGRRGYHGTAFTTPRYQVESAILKLHNRRVCCLEFHPQHHNVVMSGGKQGSIALWDMDKVRERMLFRDTHKYLVNAIKFIPWLDQAACATVSCDGTVKVLDVETGLHRELVDMNPGGYTNDKEWRMMYSADTAEQLHLVVVGDSDGRVHMLDPRTPGVVSSHQLHRKGNKVVSVALNPAEPRLLLTAGNDHTARLFDIRGLTSSSHEGASAAGGPSSGAGPSSSAAPPDAAAPSPTDAKPKRGSGGGKGKLAAVSHPAELMSLPHPRVVNAATFSPITGRKVLTTCQDNRIRVWDNITTAAHTPDREIVHSHDFNRYLTPFKAEWDPKDLNENRFVVGRYISEDFNGTALHPVDIIDAGTGQLLAQLVDHNLPTISPVNLPHPARDVIVSGSSRSLYLWAPVLDDDDDEQEGGKQVAGSSSGASTSTAAGPSSRPPTTHYRYTAFDADPGGGDGKKKGGGKKGKKAASDSDGD